MHHSTIFLCRNDISKLWSRFVVVGEHQIFTEQSRTADYKWANSARDTNVCTTTSSFKTPGDLLNLYEVWKKSISWQHPYRYYPFAEGGILHAKKSKRNFFMIYWNEFFTTEIHLARVVVTKLYIYKYIYIHSYIRVWLKLPSYLDYGSATLYILYLHTSKTICHIREWV